MFIFHTLCLFCKYLPLLFWKFNKQIIKIIIIIINRVSPGMLNTCYVPPSFTTRWRKRGDQEWETGFQSPVQDRLSWQRGSHCRRRREAGKASMISPGSNHCFSTSGSSLNVVMLRECSLLACLKPLPVAYFTWPLFLWNSLHNYAHSMIVVMPNLHSGLTARVADSDGLHLTHQTWSRRGFCRLGFHWNATIQWQTLTHVRCRACLGGFGCMLACSLDLQLCCGEPVQLVIVSVG